MGALKALFKLALLLMAAAAVAGVVAMLKRPQSNGPLSYEQWPEVPRNPSA